MGFGHCYSHDRDLTSILIVHRGNDERYSGNAGLWCIGRRLGRCVDGRAAWRPFVAVCAYTDAYTYTCGWGAGWRVREP